MKNLMYPYYEQMVNKPRNCRTFMYLFKQCLESESNAKITFPISTITSFNYTKCRGFKRNENIIINNDDLKKENIHQCEITNKDGIIQIKLN